LWEVRFTNGGIHHGGTEVTEEMRAFVRLDCMARRSGVRKIFLVRNAIFV